MGKTVSIPITEDELILLLSAIRSYEVELDVREEKADYFFRSHSLEDYKERSEKNLMVLQVRRYQLEELKKRLLSSFPLDVS